MSRTWKAIVLDVFLHVAVHSHGNVYTAEVGGGRRVQRFLKSR